MRETIALLGLLLVLLLGLAGGLVLLLLVLPLAVEPEPVRPLPPTPVPTPRPAPLRPCPPRRPCPRIGEGEIAQAPPLVGGFSFGGPIGPSGQEVICDLPVSLRTKNVGGRDGIGLCVFSSIGHAARWQDEQRLKDFQAKMRQEPGGGYPDKVDRMIERYGSGARYLQYEGSDPTILELALRTGRMPSVTYCGMDPHYNGQRVSHMVNLVYLDSSAAAILDNNFVGEHDLVWMSREEFLTRWKGGRQGWAVILLADAPPPPPRNGGGP